MPQSSKTCADMQLLPRVCFCFLTLTGLTFGDRSGSSVIVKEYDDAILNCSLNNVNIKPTLFDWRKDKKRLQVFMYDNGTLHNKGPPSQDEQFTGRVLHFPEELEHGNASIIIRKTKVTDSGNYTCQFPHLQSDKIFQIELIVVPILMDRTGENIPGASPKPIVTILDDKGSLQCEVKGGSPEPTVEWLDSADHRLQSGKSHVTPGGDIILKATVTKTGLYRCVATQETINHQIYTETFVQLRVSDFTGWVVAAVVSAALVGGVVLLAGLKAKGYNCKKGSPTETSLSSNSMQQHDHEPKQPLNE